MKKFILILLLISGSAYARGGLTTDIPVLFMPAANNITNNWQKVGLAVIGGIPVRSKCGSTLNPSGLTPPQTNDDHDLVVAKIAACAANTYIEIGGLMHFVQSELPIVINKGITLRGTGATTGTCNAATGTNCWTGGFQTDDGPQPLYFNPPWCGLTPSTSSACPNGSGMFLVTPNGLFDFGWAGCSPGVTDPQTSSCGTLIAADVAQGATIIQVASTTNFSVGMWFLIDEAPVLGTTTNPIAGQASIQASAEFLNTTDSPVVARIANPDAGLCTYSFCTNRVTEEIHKITAIGAGPCPGAGCTITFDSPLTIGFRQSGSHLARAYWPTKQLTNVASPFVDQAGFENLTFNRCNGGCINFIFTSYGWVKSSEFNYWINGAVNVAWSARTLITGNYIHDCIDCQNNGVEYPIALDSASLEVLQEDNIIVQGGKGMVGRAATGAVIAYNYFDMSFYAASSAVGNYWNDMAANGSHYAGTHHFLFEGNYANNCDGDETHGNATYHTFFRNQCTGYRSAFTDKSNGLASDDCAGTGFATTANHSNISSGTYNSGTGVISLTLVSSLSFAASTKVSVYNLTGTGANLFNLNSVNTTWTTITQSGTSVTLQGPTGQGSITISGGGMAANQANSPGPLRVKAPMAFNYWYVYGFNILGKSGMQSCAGGAFTLASTNGLNTNRVISMAGWTGGEWGTNVDPNLVSTTPKFIFNNGNFNYVNSTVDSASGYATTAPNSLFLSSAPAYFLTGSGNTWPWITPSGGTKVFTLPAKARFDAGTPFVQP